jgi:FRG domain-containing protein
VNIFDATSWEDFEKELKELRAKIGNESFPLLFRGQGNSEWLLTTTLDRNTNTAMTVRDYYDMVTGGVAPEVKTFSGVEVPERRQEITVSFSRKELLFEFPTQFPSMDLYRYMAYLRHLGFPSPLLDWSRSPYVAAFFAFREDPLVKVEKRSIYAFCKTLTGVTGGALGEPIIVPLGPYVQTHHRHFRQRCDYTFCAGFDVRWNQWRFESHQKVFDSSRPQQDHLWKFDIPSCDRIKVLRILNDYNLNAFSLFGSEESLLETMWFREYVLRRSEQRAGSPFIE